MHPLSHTQTLRHTHTHTHTQLTDRHIHPIWRPLMCMRNHTHTHMHTLRTHVHTHTHTQREREREREREKERESVRERGGLEAQRLGERGAAHPFRPQVTIVWGCVEEVDPIAECLMHSLNPCLLTEPL
jgi:hypothetical protein